jgi:hypothetical protein
VRNRQPARGNSRQNNFTGSGQHNIFPGTGHHRNFPGYGPQVNFPGYGQQNSFSGFGQQNTHPGFGHQQGPTFAVNGAGLPQGPAYAALTSIANNIADMVRAEQDLQQQIQHLLAQQQRQQKPPLGPPHRQSSSTAAQRNGVKKNQKQGARKHWQPHHRRDNNNGSGGNVSAGAGGSASIWSHLASCLLGIFFPAAWSLGLLDLCCLCKGLFSLFYFSTGLFPFFCLSVGSPYCLIVGLASFLLPDLWVYSCSALSPQWWSAPADSAKACMMADVSPQAHLVSAASPLSKPCLFIGSLNSCCLLIGFLPLHGLAGFLPPHGFAYLSLLMGYSKSKRTKKNKKKPQNQRTKKPPFHWPLWFPKPGAEEESWKMEREERRKLSVYLLWITGYTLSRNP